MGERIFETRELWREHCLVGEHFGESTLGQHFFGEHFGENTFLESTFFTLRTAFFFGRESTRRHFGSSIQFSANLFFGFFSFFYLFIAGSF